MKRLTMILTAIIMCLSVCSCDLKYTLKTKNPVDICIEPTGEYKVVPFLNDWYQVDVYYRWCGRGVENNISGKIKISSEEVEIDKTEFDDEEFWFDGCENEPHTVLHIYPLVIQKDMLKESSGKIHFEISAEAADGSFYAYADDWLYFSTEGNELCLSEEEGIAENYFINLKKQKILKMVLGGVILIGLILAGCILLKKRSESRRKAVLPEERKAEEGTEK